LSFGPPSRNFDPPFSGFPRLAVVSLQFCHAAEIFARKILANQIKYFFSILDAGAKRKSHAAAPKTALGGPVL
jgi:hypothetical protein